MPTISLTVPAGKVSLLEDAFAKTYGYQETINGEPNPETKAQFTRRQIVNFVKDTVHAYQTDQALSAARPAKDESVAS